MSEYLNENPDVLEVDQLPSRKEDEQEQLFESFGSQEALRRKKLLMKIDNSPSSQVIRNVELLDKLLLLNNVPDLTSDESSLQSEGEYSSEDGDEAAGHSSMSEYDAEPADPVDVQEIYDLTAHICDPEHPLTLGQLSIVNLPDIEVHDDGNPAHLAEVVIRITPTITHCSLATLIGLGIRVRLERSLPPRFRITILLKKGTHNSEAQVNKQLNDKERVAAACENEQLLGVVSKMLQTCK
ncbi:iron-sulfur cluster assembly protein [Maudiozyma humilis]|uniref:Iron-sulfur cluster assembly protein n=1 Tax=Maudiozyma humilis TaxID=51915 RepID=A0AAV5RSL0_MAUHU|nr:iron-sulfur cluster assembly protein [Kazachstania humilis]